MTKLVWQPLREKLALWLLLAVFACLATTYSVVTPLFEASDELTHYPLVRHLASGGGLPVQDPANQGPWLQQGSQPPLYYALAALLSRWVPSGDPYELLPPNPHADIGVVRPDGNANMVIHSQAEALPYQGTALAIHVVRLFSVLLSTLTVFFSYRIGLELLPDRPELALATAGAVAFTPMFLFISGSVNNDNLVVALASISLWLLLRLLRLPPTPARWALLGGVIGLAGLSKVSALGLLPLTALALAWLSWRRRDWKLFFWGGACVVGAAALVAGWWYWRNWRLYGDPLGFNMMVAIAGPRVARPTLPQLLSEWSGFIKAYWGVFGGMNVIAPGWFYRLYDSLALLAVGGLAVRIGWQLWQRRWPSVDQVARLILALAWPLILLGGLIRWTSLTMASQGRLIFPGIASLSFFLMCGLTGWLAPSRRSPRAVHSLPAFLAVALMAALAVWAPFGVIAPAYARPPLLTAAEEAAIPQRLDLSFAGKMQLLGYQIGASEVRPGEGLAVTLYWRAEAAMERNYSVFIHLLDQNDFVISQRDRYPGRGLFPTSQWRAGEAIADTYYVTVPANTFRPNRLSVKVGLYSLESGRRLPLRDRTGRELGDSYRLGSVDVPGEPQGGIANPVYLNFDNQIALVGYDLDRTALQPGETLQVTLYWQALRPLKQDYTAYARVHDVLGNPWAGTGDQAIGGRSPTSSWKAGQIIEERHELVLPLDIPEGAYYLQAGLYQAQTLEYLSLRGPWGHVQKGLAILARLRVSAPKTAEERRFDLPPIQYPLDVAFGEVARLKGFSLDQQTVNPQGRLRLTLYWQALGEDAPLVSYTVFNHLVAPDGRIIAQHDGPPAAGVWPTTSWVRGQVIVDRHDLAFADMSYAGEARLMVGLYSPLSQQRLLTSVGDNHVVLPIQVTVRP